MKNQTISTMFTIFSVLLCLNGFTQKSIIWRGGAPGHESDWHYPKNWSTGAAPNEFSDVTIPDVSTTTRYSPVINSGAVEINALCIHPNASLIIAKSADLLVHESLNENAFQVLHKEYKLLVFNTKSQKLTIQNKKAIWGRKTQPY